MILTASRTSVRVAVVATLAIAGLVATAWSKDRSRSLAEKLITGQWVGHARGTKGPYVFHAVNCANGRFAVAVVWKDGETSIQFGRWETDGATMTNDIERSGLFDPGTLSAISLEDKLYSNRYHIVELTSSLLVYEWRGEITRRFEATKGSEGSGLSPEKLESLACSAPPALY